MAKNEKNLPYSSPHDKVKKREKGKLSDVVLLFIWSNSSSWIRVNVLLTLQLKELVSVELNAKYKLYKENRAPCTKLPSFATQRSKFRFNAQSLTYVKSSQWQNKRKCRLTVQVLFFLAPKTLQSILWCMLTLQTLPNVTAWMFLPVFQFLSESYASNKACPVSIYLLYTYQH